MSNRTDEKWVLEWSRSSNSLHVQPLARLITLNRSRFYLDGCTPGDYVILEIGSHNAVTRAADTIRPTLIKREQEKSHV